MNEIQTKMKKDQINIHGNAIKFSLIIILVIILDQISKIAIIKYLSNNITITSFIKIMNVRNEGAGFGILQGKTFLLILFTLIILTVLIINIKEILKENYFYAVALIFGGGVGNLIDRIHYGYVTDFISIWIWPVFNVADIAISIGGIILVYQLYIQSRQS